ncbi:alpha/beta fold hydrolase [uncultured Aquimarina sp.]|uniref:alpha/beta hydrolase family protein n=1 Tax=uncultured Aquimarina sp. TaxID=575652 RepID=UPI002616C265|nr:alpha/beta fold hydrolase [uncultured Aquimarina sp.]
MIIEKKDIIVNGKHQRPILMDVFYDDQKKQQPVVIFCHGYKGFKDWGAWHLVAKSFAEAGFFFVKFNFSHNGGTIQQPLDFLDLEAFGENNYIIELDDLASVLDHITTSNFEYKQLINQENVTLIGHSRAGGITTIKTSEDTRITKLITWAGVSDYEKRFLIGEAFQTWKDDGIFYVENGRTKQQMPHRFQFYTSFIENKERLTISNATKKIDVPHLIIHGTEDPTVALQEAEDLHSWNPRSELFLVKGADHVFGAKHPWKQKEMPKDLTIITEKSIAFAIL